MREHLTAGLRRTMTTMVTVITPISTPEPPGPATPGMERRQLLDVGDRWIGWVRTTPGMAGGWHHHGDRDTYIFVSRGALIVEFGPGGRESVTMSAGEMGYVPPRTVHREITPVGEAAEAFAIRLGSGPQNVNVDAPDPE
jgi:mannose-6-phosphate isomerase-like protein (cupin superfamily)